MKNILTKLNIHFSTYILFLISFLCGYFKPIITLFIIILLHELGHIFTSIILGYNIKSINIYPFGGLSIIDKPLNDSILKDILIASSGIIVQLLLFIIIKDSTIRFYNKTLILFNIIPLIPLDGSHILNDLINLLFPYQKSLNIFYILTFIILLIFIYYELLIGKELFITIVLLVSWFVSFKRKGYILERFYLERYLHDYPYKTIKNHPHLDRRVLKKNTRHFFYHNNRYLNEHEMLDKYYKIV